VSLRLFRPIKPLLSEAIPKNRSNSGSIHRGSSLCLLATLAAVIAPLLLTSCKPGSEEGAAANTPPPSVRVAQPLQADIPVFLEVNGQTESTANVDVRARVEGYVEEIAFEPGSIVQKGDLLVKLDPEPLRQKLLRAQASLADAEAGLEKARLDVERYEPLAELRAIPRQDLTNAQAIEKRAEASVEAAKADLRSAEIDFEYAEIRAPISGRIGDKEVDVGDLVGRGEATVLAIISPIDPIWVRGSISETQYLADQRNKQEPKDDLVIYLVLPDGSVYDQQGTINFVDYEIDSTTGSLEFRTEFANPDGLLRPGQFVRLRALTRRIDDALLLPQRAVQEIQSTRAIWVIGEDNTASFRTIETGPRIESMWVITGGLSPDDRVVIEGGQKVREGMPVSPVETEIDPAVVEEYRAKYLPQNRN